MRNSMNNNSMNNNNNNSGGNNNNRRRGSSSSNSRRPSNLHELPVEQGIVCSLKESFGFIHCAERPEQIFFHYSEITNCRIDELHVDTEVEFKVGSAPIMGGGDNNNNNNNDGSNNNKKLAAYQIKVVPTGTVVWETEEEEGRMYRGVVEKVPRSSSEGGGRGSGGGGGGGRAYDADGSIRVLLPEDDADQKESDKEDGSNNEDNEIELGEGKKTKKKDAGPVVRLRVGEFSGATAAAASSSSSSSLGTGGDGTNSSGTNNNNTGGGGIYRLFRGDLVEFRILIDRRTKQRYARYITLIQTEKERNRIEREKKLLESAIQEEGIIISLNKGFGFLKSNKRREDIYFHFAHVVMPDEDEAGAASSPDGKGSPEQDSLGRLKVGQEVKFLVVTEDGMGGGGGGSDQQQQGNNSNGNSRQLKCSARQIMFLPKGSVVFHAIVAKGVKGMVTMAPQPPSPGNKGDDSREGKIRLLEPFHFDTTTTTTTGKENTVMVDDVLLHYSDSPGGVFTYQNHRNQLVSGLWVHEGDILLFDVIKETVDGCYRASPTFHTLAVGGDVVSPEARGEDNNNTEHGSDDVVAGGPPVIRMVRPTVVGRAEGTVHTLKADYGFIHFAERPIDVHFKLYDLFPDDLQDDIRKCMGIVGGPVKLEPDIAVQFDICAHGNITHAGSGNRGRPGKGGANAAQRENIRGQRIVLLPRSAISFEKVIAKGIKGVVKSVDPKQLYAGVVELDEEMQSMTLDERHPLIAQMLDAFLEESSTPNGRKALVYRDTLSMIDDDIVVEMARLKGQGRLECSHIPIPGISPHPGRLCIRRVEESTGGSETNVELTSSGGGRTNKKEGKTYKSLRFDKSSLVEDLKGDVPPGIGDIVSLDVVCSRRSGNMEIRNLEIIERGAVEAGIPTMLTPAQESGVGVVKDVVPKRNFGFIMALDENSTQRELLFFHLTNDRRGGGLRKGDEVKFDTVMEGNKRIATNVKKVPTGTVPSAASKNACFGYILMEPAHTSLADTPLRKAQSNVSAGSDKVGKGRWVETKEDGKKKVQQEMQERGYILLLEDKTGMFQKKNSRMKKRRGDTEENDADSSDDVSVDDARSIDSGGGLSSGDNDDFSGDEGASSDDDGGNKPTITVLSHVAYKNGALAIHGSGSALSMDGSTNPRRGDLVSFVRGRKRDTVRDLRVVERQKAVLQRGRLEDIHRVDTESGKNKGRAKFIAATENQEEYEIDLSEVLSCDAKILKENESVEGILHNGRIFGVCRTCDLYLTSKLGTSHKERPKLNLTVKKNRGGTIMAQSMMAKGPDGSNGFKAGWTKRTSLYAN